MKNDDFDNGNNDEVEKDEEIRAMGSTKIAREERRLR